MTEGDSNKNQQNYLRLDSAAHLQGRGDIGLDPQIDGDWATSSVCQNRGSNVVRDGSRMRALDPFFGIAP